MEYGKTTAMKQVPQQEQFKATFCEENFKIYEWPPLIDSNQELLIMALIFR